MKWFTWLSVGLVVFVMIAWLPGAWATPLAASTANVSIQDSGFQPQTITVHAGDTIIWTNNGTANHTTTSDTPGLWDSGSLSTGQGFSKTFNSVGTFTYHSSLDVSPAMTGTVSVLAPTIKTYLPYIPKDPTPTPTPTPTATPIPVTGWNAEFYNNVDLSGTPAVTRVDNLIDFDWGNGSPDPAIQADGFSGRWTRTLYFTGGNYNFFTYTEDGVRLWVDGNQLINEWHPTTGAQYYSSVPLSDGNHTVRMEFYNGSGRAAARLWYINTDTYPQPGLMQWGTWKGEYFDNTTLSGDPKVVREDDQISFNWGSGSPDPAIPANNFSVRWTASVYLNAGSYDFFPYTDDGVRLYVDGTLLVDEWHDVGAQPVQYISSVPLTAGVHFLRMEYYHQPVSQQAGTQASLFWHNTSAYPLWETELFSNMNLSGAPAVVRGDDAINFTWNGQQPDPSISANNFSIRWSGAFFFDPGNYTFTVTSDDGVRLWVDGFEAINEWRDQGATTFYSYLPISAGLHFIRMEYYQDTGGSTAQISWNKS